jgi:hypothetical protein
MTDRTLGLTPQVEGTPEKEHREGGKPSTGGELYEIKIIGHLDQDWSEWLGGLQIIPECEGNTLLIGVIPDQAALHGLLVKIRDLGLPILSLQRLEE